MIGRLGPLCGGDERESFNFGIIFPHYRRKRASVRESGRMWEMPTGVATAGPPHPIESNERSAVRVRARRAKFEREKDVIGWLSVLE
jgi:hypothetical protein